MSKRDESIIQFIEQYKELGYLPEAVVELHCPARMVSWRRRRDVHEGRTYCPV